MKAPTDELFDFVKSLTGNEKSAFKLFSKQEAADLNYLKLFNAIDSLKEFDKKKLAIILSRDAKINRIKDVKYNLQKVLLRFLQYYHNNDSVDIELQNHIHSIEILFGKRLFSLAKKQYVRAEKLAHEHHRYLTILNLQTWKQKIMLGEEDPKVFAKYNDGKYSREIRYIDLYKNNIEYQKIKVQVIGLYAFADAALTTNRKVKLCEILKNPLLKSEKMALSIPAKYSYFYILALVHYLLKNGKESHIYFKLTVGYFERAKKSPNERLAVFSRFMRLLSELRKDDEIIKLKEEALNLIETVPGKVQSKNLWYLYLTLMNNYIDYQLSVYNVDEASSASDRILSSIEAHNSPQSFLVYYGNRFIIYFLLGNYPQALRCANKVLSMEKAGARPDIVFYMNIFYLIVHYELGNEEMLQNLCKSFVRKYAKELRENKMENLLLDFLGKTIHENNSKLERIKSFVAFRKELKMLKKQDRFNLFDFVSWAESKIENRPLLDILKEKI